MKLDEATILIVDDEPQLRKIFGAWFEREGCRVLLARNGVEGLELTERNRVNLVISDIRMPVMNGIEMAQRINRLSDYVPQMLFVSGFGDIEDRDLYAIGVAKKLSKPIRREDLIEAARVCLLDKSKRWGTPPPSDEGPVCELCNQAAEPEAEDDRIAFGRGGLCLYSQANLQEGHLVQLNLTAELDTAASLVATVRWIKPRLLLSGLEIRYVDDASRTSIIRVTDNASVQAFIPRTVGARD